MVTHADHIFSKKNARTETVFKPLAHGLRDTEKHLRIINLNTFFRCKYKVYIFSNKNLVNCKMYFNKDFPINYH